MRQAVAYRDEFAPAVKLEASDGLTLAVAKAVVETGVDWTAVGELTHSARVLDLGLDVRLLVGARGSHRNRSAGLRILLSVVGRG